jgi:hypothetical protein
MFITQSSQMTPKQLIERAHVELMGNEDTVEYSGILMLGTYEVRDDIPTACTDGINCKYGSKFMVGLTDAERRGVILHEKLHMVYQHMFLWKHLREINPKLTNMACDYVINIHIVDLDRKTHGFVKLPKGGLFDERFRGMDSQQVFNILQDEQNNEGDDSEQGDGDGDGDGGTQSQDDSGGFDEHDWSATDAMSDEEIDEVTKDINQAVRQGQMAAAKLGGNKSAALSALTEPKVDWREQLRDFVMSTTSGKDISTWQRVNRRWLQHGMYMPSTISESIGRIVIATDTSGSVFDAIGPFLSEMEAIAMTVKPEKIDLLYWDTEVACHEMYTQDKLDKMSASTKPQGGGGTDVRCVPKYLKKNQIKPECVIVLTDGEVYGGWGEWDCPVLWCIVGRCKAVPSVGKVIHVD